MSALTFVYYSWRVQFVSFRIFLYSSTCSFNADISKCLCALLVRFTFIQPKCVLNVSTDEVGNKNKEVYKYEYYQTNTVVLTVTLLSCLKQTKDLLETLYVWNWRNSWLIYFVIKSVEKWKKKTIFFSMLKKLYSD